MIYKSEPIIIPNVRCAIYSNQKLLKEAIVEIITDSLKYINLSDPVRLILSNSEYDVIESLCDPLDLIDGGLINISIEISRIAENILANSTLSLLADIEKEIKDVHFRYSGGYARFFIIY